MSNVKGRIIESQSIPTSEKTGFGPSKIAILKRFWAKKGWRSGIRATRVL
jgi:hypothetical protein